MSAAPLGPANDGGRSTSGVSPPDWLDRVPGILGFVLLGIGIALIVFTIATGQAHVFLLLVVPAVTGSSPAFFVGLLLIVIGFGLLFAQAGDSDGIPPPDDQKTGPEAPRSVEPQQDRSWGGVLLVGPVPIAFGSARPLRRWVYLLLAVIGALALLGAAIAFLHP